MGNNFTNRVFLHCDMNNYFASVEEKLNPALKSVPIAVCGDPEMRHSIVMAKNGLAKNAGVITGISYFQAKKICPKLKYVKADFNKYLTETKTSREIYQKYSEKIIPYGMDEAWLDLSDTGVSIKDATQIADLIRLEIKYSQGLSASVGVSDNLIFSKLGSDLKKPDATTVISRDNYKELVWNLPASDLLFVGNERRKKLRAAGIFTIGELANSNPEKLSSLFGKVGYDLWRFANGDDSGFHPENDEIGSVGNTITPPSDLHNNEEASAIIFLLATSISARLQKHDLKACCVSICMKNSNFDKIVRQSSLRYPTDDVNQIFNQAYNLFLKNFNWTAPLRSVGVRVDNLRTRDFEQLSLFDEESKISVNIDERVRSLISKYGALNVEKTSTTKDW